MAYLPMWNCSSDTVREVDFKALSDSSRILFGCLLSQNFCVKHLGWNDDYDNSINVRDIPTFQIYT